MRKRLGTRSPKDAIDLVRKLPTYVRLVWALLRDPRVPLGSKGMLVALAGYLVWPIDVIPDFIPILGQLDDIAITLLVLERFFHSVPAEVMNDHLARIARNEDDLRRDLGQAEKALGEGFRGLRDNLLGVLEKSGKRFRSPDEAVSGLDKWEDRD